MADAGAVVDGIGAQADASQLLHQIVLFIGAARRTDDGCRIRAVFPGDATELLGDQVQCFVPTGFAEGAILFDEWRA